MKIRLKKLNEQAIVPQYSSDGAAGLDLVATSREIVDDGGFGYIEYDTGIAVEIPKGFAGYIFPRSSISKTGLILANSVGVVDSDYTGPIKCRFKAIPNCVIYEVGERIAQLVILETPKVEFEEVEELSETARGDCGFGSTGK